MGVDILSFKQKKVLVSESHCPFRGRFFFILCVHSCVVLLDILLSSLRALHSPIPQVLTTLPPF